LHNFLQNFTTLFAMSCCTTFFRTSPLCRFIAIDVGACGKQSDGGIFRHSSPYQLLISNNLNMPNAKKLRLSDVELPFVIMGDEAYPLFSYLIRPYPRRQLTESRRLFNCRLSRGRRVVESVFGILAGKWRILNKPIETFPNVADRTVKCVFCTTQS